MRFILLLSLIGCVFAQNYFLSLEPGTEDYRIAFAWPYQDRVFWLEYAEKEYYHQQKELQNPCLTSLYSSRLQGTKETIWSQAQSFLKFEIREKEKCVVFSTNAPGVTEKWSMSFSGKIEQSLKTPSTKDFGEKIEKLPLSLYHKDDLCLEMQEGNPLYLRWKLSQGNLLFQDEWDLGLECDPVPDRIKKIGDWRILFHESRVLAFSLPELNQYSIETMIQRMQESPTKEMLPKELHEYFSRYYISQEILRYERFDAKTKANLKAMLQKHDGEIPLLEVNLKEAGKIYRCLVSLPDRKARFLPTHLEFGTPDVNVYSIPGVRAVVVWEADVKNALLSQETKLALEKQFAMSGIQGLEQGIITPGLAKITENIKDQMKSLKIYSLVNKNRLRFFFFLGQEDYNLWKIYMNTGLPVQIVWASRALGLAQSGSPSAFVNLSCQNTKEHRLDEKYILRVDIASSFWENYQSDAIQLQIEYAGIPQKTVVIHKEETEKIVEMPLTKDEKGEAIYFIKYRFNKKEKKGWQEGTWESTDFPALFLME